MCLLHRWTKCGDGKGATADLNTITQIPYTNPTEFLSS